MSSFGSIFKVSETGTLIINKDEIRGIKEYEDIIKEKDAFKLLLYIYMVADPKSLLYVLDKKEKERRAKIDCKLEAKWKPTLKVLNAIKKYKIDLELSSAAKSYIAADRALYALGEDVEYIQEQVNYIKKLTDKKLKVLTSKETLELEEVSLINELNSLLGQAIANQDRLITNINKLPKLKDTVDDLMAKYTQQEGKKTVYGGGNLGNREMV